MTSHDVERALVQGLISIADDRFNETIAAMQTDLSRLRDSWAAGYAEQRQAAEDRMAAMRNEDRQYLQSIATGEADEPVPSHELAGAAGASVPPGHRPQHPIPDPHAAELARARAIAEMPLDEYANRRAELGIRSAGGGLFG